MRIITAGESHGEYEAAIIEGFPHGVTIEEAIINHELKRRMSGFGRGPRMGIEADTVQIVSGVRNKVTLGSPITLLVKNKDVKILAQEKDQLPLLSVPRPAHADLAGLLKYQQNDVRNILERASARETVARVCAGAVCRQLLAHFNVRIASFTVGIGSVISQKKPANIKEIITKTKNSQLNCIDSQKEKMMIAGIRKADNQKDTLGGIVEIWIEGVCPGLGSMMHFDKRLDAKLAYYLMSIPAIKGVEIGLGFDYAKKSGSVSHDEIFYAAEKGFYHKTNNSGGIEGGMSTGEPIIARLAMKPIATLRQPLMSVNFSTRKKEKAIIQRSDVCAVFACGVIAEAMCAIALAESFLEKFGQDSLKEISRNYQRYMKSV